MRLVEDVDPAVPAHRRQRDVLAQRADAEVFGPNDPTPEQVDAFWQEVDQIVLGLGKDAGFFTRLKARLSLRSLLKDSTVTSRL